MSIHTLGTQTPEVPESAFVAPSAEIIGAVSLGKQSSVWFQSVLRGDTEPITIGDETNIQDVSVIHADPGFPAIIGNRVTVGHRCILHGCTIADDCLIGMGAILMNGVKLGTGCIVGAGSVILERTEIPPFSLVVGSPAVVKKTYDSKIIDTIRRSSRVYVERLKTYQHLVSV